MRARRAPSRSGSATSSCARTRGTCAASRSSSPGRYELGRRLRRTALRAARPDLGPATTAPTIYAAPISGCVWSGHFDEARRLAVLHDEITAPLTPHHRLHGVAILVEVEELLGDWGADPSARPAHGERRSPTTWRRRACGTPARCSSAPSRAPHLGDEAAATRLERGGRGARHRGLRRRARHPAHAARARARRPRRGRTAPRDASTATRLVPRLDGPRHDRHPARRARGGRRSSEVEEEATAHLRPNTYLAPFALRALGVVRDETALVERALARFEALGLAWHAERTAPSCSREGAGVLLAVDGFQRTSVQWAGRQLVAGGGDRLGDALPAADRRAALAVGALERDVQEVGVEAVGAGAAAARGSSSAMAVMAGLLVSLRTRASSPGTAARAAEPARVLRCG